ncbi:hypothetical protein [Methylomagnum ishizawai]|uniref:hypothetical protein n=1 Tax=Methylomagnum ishizawai TaxID=1760988 RepID=UPI001C32F0F5|nr:hypothetical protein [Methylomagnum ishizawai]BBL75803.1 hypothetical protein MishRS11D_29010 [Methylomagnum ishizawai]
MAETQTQAPRPEPGEADINPKAVLGVFLAVLVMLAVVAWVAWWLVESVAREMPATGAVPPVPVPTAPPLQIDPAADLAVLRAREDRLLHSTEWIDREAGIARIPIETAMALLARRAAETTGGGRP